MVVVDQEKCIGCGRCVSDCVYGNLSLQDGKVRCGGDCILCGHCVAICPMDAVTIPEYDMEDVEACSEERLLSDIDGLLHTIKSRRSIRCYKEQTVERAKLEKLVQAGRYTATAVNRQDCRFILVQDALPELKKLVWRAMDAMLAHPDTLPENTYKAYKRIADKRAQNIDYLFRNAPAVLYIASESVQNACLAAQNIELAAAAQGLGVMYNGYLTGFTNMSPEVLSWLDTSDKPIAMSMLLGYPDVRYRRTAPRRAADVRWR